MSGFVFRRSVNRAGPKNSKKPEKREEKPDDMLPMNLKSAYETVQSSAPIAVFPAKDPGDRAVVEAVALHFDPDAPQGSVRLSVIRMFNEAELSKPVLNCLYVRGEDTDPYIRAGSDQRYEYAAHGLPSEQAIAVFGEVADVPEGFSPLCSPISAPK